MSISVNFSWSLALRAARDGNEGGVWNTQRACTIHDRAHICGNGQVGLAPATVSSWTRIRKAGEGGGAGAWGCIAQAHAVGWPTRHAAPADAQRPLHGRITCTSGAAHPSQSLTIEEVASKVVEHYAADRSRRDRPWAGLRGRQVETSVERTWCDDAVASDFKGNRVKGVEGQGAGRMRGTHPTIPARTSRPSCPASVQTRPPDASGRCFSRPTPSSRAAPAVAVEGKREGKRCRHNGIFRYSFTVLLPAKA